jgi:cation transport protein ChaC
MAFRVAAADAEATLRYLREREQVTSVYREALVPVRLVTSDRPEVIALTFLVERAHPSYAGALSLKRQVELIRGGCGRSGNNIDYLASTLGHLAELDIRERPLERLMSLVGPHVLRRGAAHARPGAAALMQEFRRRPIRVRRVTHEEARRFSYRYAVGLRGP